MATVTGQPNIRLERVLSLEIVRVTERAAVSAARLCGRGDEKAADQAAVDAMRRELNKLADRRHGGDRRGRARRGAHAVHRRDGRQPDRPQGRYRGRSARGHHAVRQGHAGRHRHHGDGGGRQPAQRPRRLHGEDRDRPRLSAGRDPSRCVRRRRTSATSPRPRASSRPTSRRWCSIGRAMPT